MDCRVGKGDKIRPSPDESCSGKAYKFHLIKSISFLTQRNLDDQDLQVIPAAGVYKNIHFFHRDCS